VADKVYAAERTRQAIAAAESGDIEGARSLLAEALSLDPQYELAWLWFAAVATQESEKKFCLEKARDVNPLHEASEALNPLKSVPRSTPPELQAIIDPPPPEFVKGYVPELRKARRRRNWKRGIAALLALLIVGALVATVNFIRSDKQYLAIVVSDTTDGQDSGQEMINAAQWAVERWNESSRNGTHTLVLKTFVDNADPETAKNVANEIVADGRFLGVIGHPTSAASQAAGPIYAAAGIPVITSTATADAVTKGNPWYFRTVFDNASQAQGIAAYVSTVLNKKKSIIVSSTDAYGTTLHDSYVASMKAAGGTIQADIRISPDPAALDTSIAQASREIQAVDKPGPIVLATLDRQIGKLAKVLTSEGDSPLFVGTDSLSNDVFFKTLRGSSTKVINSAIAASPVVKATLTGEAVTFYEDFNERFGYVPTWAAPLTYDAVDAFADAFETANLGFTGDSRTEDRVKIKDRFDGARTVGTGLRVLTGQLYFNPADSAVRPVAFEDSRIQPNGKLSIESASQQLAPYSPTAGVPLKDEIASGGAVTFLDQSFTIQHVVAMGFNINSLDGLDVAAQTYEGDFFIWFKYEGNGFSPTDVIFANTVDPGLGLGPAQRLSTVGGQTYALYRVTGKFKAPMEFASFPFDHQELPVVVQHRTLPASKIVYVPDADLDSQSQADRLESGVDAGSTIDQIPNWKADWVSFFSGSVGNTSSLGDPHFVAGASGITYSQMASTTGISRDVASFLIKNILPLMLLAAVTYVSLWLGHKENTSRISFGVTGILTGAVMLNTVTSSLPAVDYTVAIEWAYYAFITLAGACILVTLLGRRWTEHRRLGAVRALDRTARIAYPLVILGIVITYWYTFAG